MSKESHGGLVSEKMQPQYNAEPLIRLNGQNSSQPYGQLKQTSFELGAQLNLTRVTKKKDTTPERHVLKPKPGHVT